MPMASASGLRCNSIHSAMCRGTPGRRTPKFTSSHWRASSIIPTGLASLDRKPLLLAVLRRPELSKKLGQQRSHGVVMLGAVDVDGVEERPGDRVVVTGRPQD